MGLGDWWRGLGELFFPTVCLSCSAALGFSGELLCMSCNEDLPTTENWKQEENELTDRLLGRLPLQFAAAAYTFRDGNVCQQLIHALKYQHRPDIGRRLGANYGSVLAAAPSLRDLTGIVPVPIHHRRRQQRGYNQAEAIAEGLSVPLKVPVYSDALRRKSFAGSQTKRGKLERLENVRDSFGVGRGNFTGGHLLLVDDVMTTGATLDFCGNILLAAHPDLRLSVATLAVTERA